LVNGTLIDGTGADPLQDAVLVLREGKVAAAGKRLQIPIPTGERVIDVQGATILPGFINAHVHDAFAGGNLEAWAQAGITTVRDEGITSDSYSLAELTAQRDAEWGGARYARLVSAGWMIGPPGGYGGLHVSSPADARRKVLEELAQGTEFIKLALEDGYGSGSTLPVLPAGELTAIVTTAHEEGALVSAHVTEAAYLETVVESGVDDVAHMPWDFVPDDLMANMIARDILVVPTLTVLEAYGALAGSQANLRRFVAMGGRVALGNDYTDVPQNGFGHFELGMPMHEIGRMAGAGMSSMQIIVAATKNAASVCGLEDELGTLEVGKRADVLVVNGDPLQDLGALTDIRMVIHSGIVIRGGDR
jgi:imidazolonepropionase-like amidohydrolase